CCRATSREKVHDHSYAASLHGHLSSGRSNRRIDQAGPQWLRATSNKKELHRLIRALWLTSHYPNPGNKSGGAYFRTQAHALRRMGVEVTVVTPTAFAPAPLARMSRKWRAYHETPTRLVDEGT